MNTIHLAQVVIGHIYACHSLNPLQLAIIVGFAGVSRILVFASIGATRIVTLTSTPSTQGIMLVAKISLERITTAIIPQLYSINKMSVFLKSVVVMMDVVKTNLGRSMHLLCKHCIFEPSRNYSFNLNKQFYWYLPFW